MFWYIVYEDPDEPGEGAGACVYGWECLGEHGSGGDGAGCQYQDDTGGLCGVFYRSCAGEGAGDEHFFDCQYFAYGCERDGRSEWEGGADRVYGNIGKVEGGRGVGTRGTGDELEAAGDGGICAAGESFGACTL